MEQELHVKIRNEDEMSNDIMYYNFLISLLVSDLQRKTKRNDQFFSKFYNANRFVKVFTNYVFVGNFTVGGAWNKNCALRFEMKMK